MTTRSRRARAPLRVYLNDHRAGAEAGIALMERSRRSNEGTPLGDLLADLGRELDDDRAALAAVMRSLDVRPDVVKQLVARAAELVGRLKSNGRLVGYSPASRVLELEALLAGIDAKHSLWVALAAVGVDAAGDPDFAWLAARAESQRDRLRPHHAAAASALSADSSLSGTAPDPRLATDGGSGRG